jgi:hypothetical protein
LLKSADAAAHLADQRILTGLTADEQRQLKQLLAAVGTSASGEAQSTA